ncbi:MAG: hypothetical protein R3D02_03905 [Hyphomicrobiales bacterium]
MKAGALLAAVVRRCLKVLRPVALALLLSVIVPFGQHAFAGQVATVEAFAMKEGFGRLIITFADRLTLPEYNAQVNNGVLVVSFKTEVSAAVDRVGLTLASYVTVARADPGGMALRFALARAVRVNTMEAGEKLFVDLLPYDWKGLPPGLPEDIVAELARRAEAAAAMARAEERARLAGETQPVLDVRVGRQPTFTRFSFGWNVPFEAGFARDGQDVTVDFDVVADADLGPIRSDMPPLVEEIGSEVDGKGMKIKLKVAASADVRAFRDGAAYVVDVADPNAAATRPDVEQKISEAVSGRPAGDGAMIVTRGEAGDAVADPATWAPLAEVDVSSRPLAPATGGRDEDQPIAPLPAQKATVPPPPAEKPKVADKPAVPTIPAPDAGGMAAAGRYSTASPKYIHVEARRVGDTVRLVFPFDSDTPAAVFRRGANLWIVFDSGLPIDLRAVRNDLGHIITDSQITRSGSSQAIRLTFDEPRLTTLGSEGSAWIVTIGEMILSPSRPLDIERASASDGRSIVRVPLNNAGSVHWIDDPVIGDRIVAITALGPPRGFIKPLNFVEFSILPSAHGVAVVPLVDNLDADLEGGVLTLSRDTGLSLSNGSGRIVSVAPAASELARPGFIDFRAWQEGGLPAYRENLEALQHAAANAEEGKRSEPRLDLARFYLANGLAYEAIGILDMIGRESNTTTETADYRVLLGAADVMANRAIDAYKVLADPALDTNPDAHLWRLLTHDKLQNWLEVRREVPEVEQILASYPLALQTDVNLAAARAAIEVNDFAEATGHLAEINPATTTPDRVAAYDLLRARLADASGRTDEALGYYDRVIKTGPRPVAAEAELRKLSQMKRDGVLDADKGIEALESLTAIWRGDQTELKALRLLSQLYVDRGRYREAFTTMRAAMIAAPEDNTSRLVQDDMSTVFADLYLNGKAEGMEPLDALALFYDFRHLTPVGRRGDEMVRRLADRLASPSTCSSRPRNF